MSRFDLSPLNIGGVPPSFISVEHAAQLMDCSTWTVRRWITNDSGTMKLVRSVSVVRDAR